MFLDNILLIIMGLSMVFIPLIIITGFVERDKTPKIPRNYYGKN